jgi:hypothetical protein
MTSKNDIQPIQSPTYQHSPMSQEELQEKIIAKMPKQYHPELYETAPQAVEGIGQHLPPESQEFLDKERADAEVRYGLTPEQQEQWAAQQKQQPAKTT